MIPIITLTDDAQIKALLVEHGRVTDLDPPEGFKVEPGGFRTHCVWSHENRFFAVTRYAGYPQDKDNGYCGIILDASIGEELASSIISQFIESNQDKERPCYALWRKINQEAN